MSNHILIRHSAPSKLDHAPWGTSCKVMNVKGDAFELYTQFGTEESNPHWQLMGNFSNDATDAHIVEKLTLIK